MSCRWLGCVLLLLSMTAISARAESTQEQRRFIEAAFQLDVAVIERMLAADQTLSQAVYGVYDREVFRDPWTLGYSHMGSKRWTALQAACNSNAYPDPIEPVENTSASLDQARATRAALPREVRVQRDAVRLKIVTLLVKAKAPIDHHDGHGATALYSALYNHFDDAAAFLVRSGAAVNTRTMAYIDGASSITPLHRALGRPAMISLLLEHGADKGAKTDDGKTPYQWALAMDYRDGIDLLKP